MFQAGVFVPSEVKTNTIFPIKEDNKAPSNILISFEFPKTGITKNYSSPENILHCLFGATFENDDRSDIWSLGVVFYRLFVKNANFVFPWTHLINQDSNNNYNQSLKRIILKERDQSKNQYLGKCKACPAEIRELINECLQVNFERRPYIKHLLKKFRIIQENMEKNEKIKIQ